jgi:sugar lactone lactonase YvrE
MRQQARSGQVLSCASVLALAVAAALAVAGTQARTQTIAPTNSGPNPYRTIESFAKLPEGRIWGSTAAVDIDPDGASIWVAERCSAQGFIPASQMREGQPFNCDGMNLDPVLKFDASGKLVKSFGVGLIVFPHGLHVDFEGNIWVTDGIGRGAKGHTVHKFSPDGRLLMTLGKPGKAGVGNDEFNAPSATYVARNGDIFVADGHGGDTNARIVKFDKNGKFIKTWGKKGNGPGEMDGPHTLAMDSRGRLFLGDRGNNRIQIFDQDGAYIAQWHQFSRPSGVFIDKNDIIYVADSESGSVAPARTDWKRGIRTGRVSDGAVTAFIPDPSNQTSGTSAAEGVAADTMGNIFGAEVGPKRVNKYVKN